MVASDSEVEQCLAITDDGERCERPAGENGFCYQHGPDDETVDGEEINGDATDNDDTETPMTDDIENTEIGSVRDKVQGVAEDVIGRPLTGIVAIDQEDDDWRVAVEVIERSSVPDTQDILGRYEITLDDDEDHTITGYRRTHRYRRDDMDQDI